MPDQSSNLTALRANGHKIELYLSALIASEPIWYGTLSATPAAASAINLSVTGSGGSSSGVRPGMRVVIETAGGAFKGMLTVRSAGTVSSTNLPVREVSSGHVEAASGDVYRVYNDFQLVDKLVAATETFDPDHLAYSDENSAQRPIALSGGVWAGWVDSGQTYATVVMAGSGSYAVDEDSGGSLTHLWTLPSGVAFAPGSADSDANPTLRVNAGYYVVEHVVTDSSNSTTETQYVCIRVHDANDPPYALPEDVSLASERGRGFGVTGLRLFENVTLAELPDRAPVVLWCREYINGTRQSFGAKIPSRSHILCMGYLRRDTGRIDNAGSPLTLDIMQPIQRLGELPGFSKVMLRADSPAAWEEVEGLTVKRALIQIIRYYTNATALFDFAFDGLDDVDYPRFYVQKNMPLEQLREVADGRDCLINSDATGRLEVQRAQELTPLADRDSLPTTITLGLADLIAEQGAAVEIVRDHFRPVETYRARGFTGGTTVEQSAPAFAKWAASPGTGSTSTTTERLILDEDAGDLFSRVAMRGAWEDGVFIDADDNDKQYHAPEVRLTLPGSYRGLFQYYREWVQLDLDETTNPRGIDLRVFRFIPMRSEIQFRGGTARVVLTLRAATYATGAVDDTPDTEVIPPYEPPVTYPPPVTPNPPVDGNGLIPGTPTIALFISDNDAPRTSNPNAGSPAWTPLDLTGLANWSGDSTEEFVVDAYSPKYLGTGTTVNGWIVTADVPNGAILRITDISGSPALTNQKAIGVGVGLSINAQFERGVQNWGIVVVSSGGGTVAYYTTDGTNWTTSSVDAYYDTYGNHWRCGLTLNPHVAGAAYTSTLLATGSSNVATPPSGVILVTSNYGASWSSTGLSVGFMKAGAILMPYAAPDYLFHGYRTGSATSVYRLYRSRLSTSAQVDISPVVSGAIYGVDANQTNRQISAADDDANTVILVGTSVSAGKRGVFLTRNALASSPTWTALVEPATSMPYRGVYVVGRNAAYLFGVNGAIAYWNGAGVRSLKGNLSTTGTVVGLCGL